MKSNSFKYKLLARFFIITDLISISISFLLKNIQNLSNSNKDPVILALKSKFSAFSADEIQWWIAGQRGTFIRAEAGRKYLHVLRCRIKLQIECFSNVLPNFKFELLFHFILFLGKIFKASKNYLRGRKFMFSSLISAVFYRNQS